MRTFNEPNLSHLPDGDIGDGPTYQSLSFSPHGNKMATIYKHSVLYRFNACFFHILKLPSLSLLRADP